MKLEKLRTKYIGRNLIYFESLDSTQLEAWRLIEKNIIDGSIVVADVQTNGQGTHGRKWYSNEHGNVAFSTIIYPNCNVKKINGITLDVAKIIIDIFKKLYNLNLEIKFPNDIVYDNKKLCGILTETKVVGEKVKALVIGIGIDLNQTDFPYEIKDTATSIKKEFKIDINREDIIAEICNELENLLYKLLN